MKTALASIATLLVLGFSSAAQAVVPVDGTFRPAQCGQQAAINEMIVDIRNVCFGRIYGLESEDVLNAVSFQMSDGTERVYRVENISRLMVLSMNGETQSVFHVVDENGFGFAMNVVEDQEGTVKTALGNAQGWDFYVPKFETVFTAQSL